MNRTTSPSLPIARKAPVLLFVVNVSWFFLSHRLALAVGARGLGYEIHLATEVASDRDRANIAAAGIHLHEFRIGRNEQGVLSNLRLIAGFYQLFRQLEPDIVHLVTMKPVVLGGLAARVAHIRAVVAAIPGLGYAFMARGGWASIRRIMIKAGLGISLGHPNSAMIFQNPDDRSALIRARVVNSDRCILIRGAGVDTESFAAAPEPQGAVRVLLASRMLREKGIEVFVGAATKLRQRGVAAEFLLAGKPDPANPGSISATQLRDWHDSGVVSWLGHCEDMAALMQSVHIVCLPSFYGEGVPKVLIEAAATGRPIVASDMPGCREIVHEGVTGLLVPPQDTDALAAALARLIKDGDLRRELGAGGRRLAVADFELAGVVKQTMAVYARLLEQDRK